MAAWQSTRGRRRGTKGGARGTKRAGGSVAWRVNGGRGRQLASTLSEVFYWSGRYCPRRVKHILPAFVLASRAPGPDWRPRGEERVPGETDRETDRERDEEGWMGGWERQGWRGRGDRIDGEKVSKKV